MKLYYNNIYNLILIIICQIRKLWLSVRRQSFHEISGETNYFYLIERKAHLLYFNVTFIQLCLILLKKGGTKIMFRCPICKSKDVKNLNSPIFQGIQTFPLIQLLKNGNVQTEITELKVTKLSGISVYYKILNLIKEKDLSNKISVNEVLLELSKVYEVCYDNKRKLGPIPERVNRLTQNLGINIKHIP